MPDWTQLRQISAREKKLLKIETGGLLKISLKAGVYLIQIYYV